MDGILRYLLRFTGRSSWYHILSRRAAGTGIRFWNFGYTEKKGELTSPLIKDEADGTHINLYRITLAGADLQGKRVLEVACGPGGGAEILNKYFSPERVIALDYSRMDSWVNQNQTGFHFLQADAQHLPFPNNIFDIVFCVEAIHSFTNQRSFIEQVGRVLHPNGELLFADFCTHQGAVELEQKIGRAGFKILAWDNLTAGVLQAIQLDTDRRSVLIQSLISRSLPKVLQPLSTALVNNGRQRLTKAFQEETLIYLRGRACKVG